MKIKKNIVLATVVAMSGVCLAGWSTFDAKDTGPDHYYFPSSKGTHDWSDNGATFNMNVSAVVAEDFYDAWGGFTYSDVNNPDVGGYGNQYAVCGSGVDVSGSGAYAVGYVDAYTPVVPTISFASDQTVNSLYVNNTAYTELAILNGEGPATAFSTGDWCKLTISAFDSVGSSLSSVVFDLADYTSADSADHYVVDTWTQVDLTSLGDNVRSLKFDVTSSDVGGFGMNTPAYFAIDNVDAIPEPATGLFMLVGFGLLVRLRRTVTYRK